MINIFYNLYSSVHNTNFVMSDVSLDLLYNHYIYGKHEPLIDVDLFKATLTECNLKNAKFYNVDLFNTTF